MTFSAMLPATQLPPGQFPINPLESSPYCQGFMLRKDTEQAAQSVCSGNVKMDGTGERLEGSRQRVHVVHSLTLWNLNTGNSTASPVGLFLIKMYLYQHLYIQYFFRPLMHSSFSSITNLCLTFYYYSSKGHFEYYIKGSKNEFKKSERPSKIFSAFLTLVLMKL